MARLSRIVLALALLTAVAASPALAWQCPVQQKAAEEAIKKAEGMNVPPEAKAMLEDAKRLVAESKKHHADGSTKVEHARSMWKAKAALAIAESVITISQP
jgi:hypothetical protein